MNNEWECAMTADKVRVVARHGRKTKVLGDFGESDLMSETYITTLFITLYSWRAKKGCM